MTCNFREPVFLEDKIYEFDKEVVEDTIKITDKIIKKFKKGNNMKIEVFYDGKYPNVCLGCLIIKIDGKEIYNKEHRCYSTGSIVWLDDNWNIGSGKLVWDDAKYFSKEIQKAVSDELKKMKVCCGGCVRD